MSNLLSKQVNPIPVTEYGIAGSEQCITSENYVKNGISSDPLNNAQHFANKPASSIPTIFARMLFVDSALRNIDNIKAKDATTYSRAVSQWLDLLELIFRKGNRLKYVEWKADEQIKILEKSKNENHRLLAEALQVHKDIYLQGANRVYLIFDENGNLMGGTSPYTFVYTSPNYKSNQPVRSLLQREDDFKEFVVRIYYMLKGNGISTDRYPEFKGFYHYMEAVTRELSGTPLGTLNEDSPRVLPSSINEDYEVIMCNNQPIAIVSVNGDKGRLTINLYKRKDGPVETDFYMRSNVIPFDPLTTPMVLPAEGKNEYDSFILHDNIEWNSSLKVPQDASISYDTKHDLPDNSGVAHTWLTEINFLESKLVQLLYEVDEDKFYGALNVPATTVNGQGVSYLLPIKPVLLRYFTVDKIKQMVKYEMVNGMINITLSIPVQNKDKKPTGHVVFTKTYNPATDLFPIAVTPFKDVISVGISPFVRYTDIEEGLRKSDEDKDVRMPLNTVYPDRYTVLLQACSLGKDQDIALDFVTVGDGSLPETEAEATDRIKASEGSLFRIARFYDVRKPFEALQVQVKNNDRIKGGGMLMPMWDKAPSIGENEFIYSIDFGTTNTHMAFVAHTSHGDIAKSAGGVKTSGSFKADEIKMQVQYLAQFPAKAKNESGINKLATFVEYVYGKHSKNIGKTTLIDQARIFYPNFLVDEYTFPIRTVVTRSSSEVPDNAKIFNDISVGFHHSKEYSETTASPYRYNEKLKWNLEESVGSGPARTTARLFFVELLQMIRNHWIMQPDVNLSVLPRFVITYPLAMNNVMNMMSVWKEAYEVVFGQRAEPQSFTLVPESLAPAFKLICDAKAQKTSGLLNVDIGGGTTDLQYYYKYGNDVVSRYDSVRFAGDDLWGGGYENVKTVEASQNSQKDNVFTRFADRELSKAILTFDSGELTKYEEVDYKGKEKINLLLRDSGKAFYNAFRQSSASQETAFKVIQLHYAALIYHIANWLKSDTEGMALKFPGTLHFTGFGSKYIPFLFGEEINSNDNLTEYTKALFKAFGIDDIPFDFKLQFTDNPKDVTAEGAALYAAQPNLDRKDMPKQLRHLGFDGYVSGQRLTWADMAKPEFKDLIIKYFDDFIDKFQAVESNELTPLSTELADKLKRRAINSFNEMYTVYKPSNDKEGQGLIKDSLFFWMLKGSLFDLDN